MPNQLHNHQTISSFERTLLESEDPKTLSPPIANRVLPDRFRKAPSIYRRPSKRAIRKGKNVHKISFPKE